MDSNNIKEGRKHKISICTVCMNRLHHLKQTLPMNIEDNISYGNVEFVVLGYNSKDGLSKWIRTEMKQYLDMGVLVYYETNEPKYFHVSHSKNIAARCTSGDIICNVDADNFIGKGFVFWVNKIFNNQTKIFISSNPNSSIRDCLGRICVGKKDFLQCTGYDENMIYYGFEDDDLKQRLRLMGLKNLYIGNQEFLTAITHDDQERLKNNVNLSELNAVLVRFIDYKSSYLLFLFKNSKYCLGKVLNNRLQDSLQVKNIFPANRIHTHEYSLENDAWEKGEWKFLGKDIVLDNIKIWDEITPKDNIGQEFKYCKMVNGKRFNRIVDKEVVLGVNMFFSMITNRNIMEENLRKKRIVVNNTPFGRAYLFKNFSYNVSLK